MTYHTICIKSEEFYTALIRARKLAGEINEMFKANDLPIEVFPYRSVGGYVLVCPSTGTYLTLNYTLPSHFL